MRELPSCRILLRVLGSAPGAELNAEAPLLEHSFAVITHHAIRRRSLRYTGKARSIVADELVP